MNIRFILEDIRGNIFQEDEIDKESVFQNFIQAQMARRILVTFGVYIRNTGSIHNRDIKGLKGIHVAYDYWNHLVNGKQFLTLGNNYRHPHLFDNEYYLEVVSEDSQKI